MKKFTFLLIMVGFFATGCSNNPEIIDSGVKVISNCCKEIGTLKSSGPSLIKKSEQQDPEPTQSAEMLPANSWDAKQLLW